MSQEIGAQRFVLEQMHSDVTAELRQLQQDNAKLYSSIAAAGKDGRIGDRGLVAALQQNQRGELRWVEGLTDCCLAPREEAQRFALYAAQKLELPEQLYVALDAIRDRLGLTPWTEWHSLTPQVLATELLRTYDRLEQLETHLGKQSKGYSEQLLASSRAQEELNKKRRIDLISVETLESQVQDLQNQLAASRKHTKEQDQALEAAKKLAERLQYQLDAARTELQNEKRARQAAELGAARVGEARRLELASTVDGLQVDQAKAIQRLQAADAAADYEIRAGGDAFVSMLKERLSSETAQREQAQEQVGKQTERVRILEACSLAEARVDQLIRSSAQLSALAQGVVKGTSKKAPTWRGA
mmetsp:Transcript_19445/g.46890  ORF Transcript_19445/g.46890 Transcript_19445/m.46890 type:complete len:358 (+) Transcript_19445:47-1120(+)